MYPARNINDKIFNICKATLTFDRVLTKKTTILVYDSKVRLSIKDAGDTKIKFNDDHSYNFFSSSTNKIEFIVIGNKNDLIEESLKYEDSSLRVSFLED